MTPPRRSGAVPSRAEIEGFLAGVSHRLGSVAGAEREVLRADLARAQAAAAAGRWSEAEATLRALEERLDELEGEPELSEFPRGLIGYVPLGDRGHPTPLEEDPLSNRLILIGRLRDVRRAAGRDVVEASRLIDEAHRAFRDGDRLTARERIDRAHGLLETDRVPGTEG